MFYLPIEADVVIICRGDTKCKQNLILILLTIKIVYGKKYIYDRHICIFNLRSYRRNAEEAGLFLNESDINTINSIQCQTCVILTLLNEPVDCQ